MVKVYVIIAVHNRLSITKQFIDRIINQTYQNTHLIIVDDGSTDGTYEYIQLLNINKTIIRGDGNLWWGGSLHQAYLWLKVHGTNSEDIVLIANDDIIMEQSFIEDGARVLLNNNTILLTANGYGLQSKQLKDSAIFFDFVSGTSRIAQAEEEANCASTHALFFRVGDFKNIGGFHPRLLPHYGSDYEFAIRAWRKGYKIITSSDLNYFYNEETTGNTNYNGLNLIQFVTKLFSKKSVYNPIYRFTFIFLACPIRYIPIHLILQIKRYINNLRHLLNKEKDN